MVYGTMFVPFFMDSVSTKFGAKAETTETRKPVSGLYYIDRLSSQLREGANPGGYP